MITLKDYAKNKNITYEAVRQQVVRYRKDLDGHIFKEKRTQYLDEYAVEFLDAKRADNPIVIVETAKDEEIEQLKTENKALLLRITELQNMLIEEKDKLLKEKDKLEQLQQEKIALLEQGKVEQGKGLLGRIIRRWTNEEK